MLGNKCIKYLNYKTIKTIKWLMKKKYLLILQLIYYDEKQIKNSNCVT